MHFSIFTHITNNTPETEVTIEDIVKLVQDPSLHIDTRDKSDFPYFCVHTFKSTRKKEHIKTFNNYIALDIDRKSNTHLTDAEWSALKIKIGNESKEYEYQRTFNKKTKTYKETFPVFKLVYSSYSGGLRVIAQVTEIRNEAHYIYTVNHYIKLFKDTYNVIVDECSKKVTQPFFIVYDKDCIYNELALEWANSKLQDKEVQLKRNTRINTETNTELNDSLPLIISLLQQYCVDTNSTLFDSYEDWVNMSFNAIAMNCSADNYIRLSHLAKQQVDEKKLIRSYSAFKSQYEDGRAVGFGYFRAILKKLGIQSEAIQDLNKQFNKVYKYEIDYFIKSVLKWELKEDLFTDTIYVNNEELHFDTHIAQVEGYLNDLHVTVPETKIKNAFLRLSRQNCYDSVNELLDSLPKLDYNTQDPLDTPIFQNFVKKFNLTELDEYQIWRWMLGSFINFTNTTGKEYFDEMLILIGEQGCGKTHFLRKTLNIFDDITYKDNTICFDMTNKDGLDAMFSNMLVVDDELSLFSKADINTVKKATSISSTSIRKPYRSNPTKRNRRFTMAAATNDFYDIFNDTTGGRRFLFVDFNESALKTHITREEMFEVWGYFYTMFKDNITFKHYDSVYKQQLQEKQEEKRYKNDGEVDLKECIINTGDKTDFMTLPEILRRYREIFGEDLKGGKKIIHKVMKEHFGVLKPHKASNWGYKIKMIDPKLKKQQEELNNIQKTRGLAFSNF